MQIFTQISPFFQKNDKKPKKRLTLGLEVSIFDQDLQDCICRTAVK
jgi:hypothetical protein